MSIDLLDILKIATSSSILTALLGWGLNHLFVHRPNLKREARYLAQRIAVVLEKYAADCANSISEKQLYDESGGNAGRPQLTLPGIELLPDGAEWKTIDSDLMDRVLSMPNELALANQAIMFWWNEVDDPDRMRMEGEDQVRECGLRAWSLASELRERCGIPKSTLPVRHWDFVATLRKPAEVVETKDRRSE
jgi:hypothetical protein